MLFITIGLNTKLEVPSFSEVIGVPKI